MKIHSFYDGKPQSETEVVWLKVECPSSPRGLCISIFEKLDEILGETYIDKYGGSRSTISDMIPGVGSLLRKHCLGLLVIDEIQNLDIRHSGGGQELLNFIVRIINDLGVPVLMIGTGTDTDFLAGAFRVTRRMTGMLEPYWDRLDQKHLEWQMFSEELVKYLYVQKTTSVGPDFMEAFYRETQGIPDLCVKLFYLAQWYSIINEIEELTPAILEKVAAIAFVHNGRYLADLRSGKVPKTDLGKDKLWEQEKMDLGDQSAKRQPAKGKKKRVEAPDVNPTLNLLGVTVKPGESVYDTLRRAGRTHSAEESSNGAAQAA